MKAEWPWILGKDVQLSHHSNPVASHFMNQRLGLRSLPLQLLKLFYAGMLSIKTHSENTEQWIYCEVVFLLLLQIQEAIWTFYFYFYFFSFYDVTLKSSAHEIAVEKNSCWNIELILLSPLESIEKFKSNLNVAWPFMFITQKSSYSCPSK